MQLRKENWDTVTRVAFANSQHSTPSNQFHAQIQICVQWSSDDIFVWLTNTWIIDQKRRSIFLGMSDDSVSPRHKCCFVSRCFVWDHISADRKSHETLLRFARRWATFNFVASFKTKYWFTTLMSAETDILNQKNWQATQREAKNHVCLGT